MPRTLSDLGNRTKKGRLIMAGSCTTTKKVWHEVGKTWFIVVEFSWKSDTDGDVSGVAGNTLATDHWGATGVAAMMEPFSPAFKTAGGGVVYQRFGSGNQVLSEATSGDGWLLTGLGIPKDANGMSTTGTDLFFGRDQYSQYIRNNLCLTSCQHWYASSLAGCGVSVWCLLSLMLCSCVSCRSDRMNYYRRKQNAH